MTNIDGDGLEKLASDLVGRERTNAMGEPIIPRPDGEELVRELRSVVELMRATAFTQEMDRVIHFVIPSWSKGYVDPPKLARAWPLCDVTVVGHRRYSAEELARAASWEDLDGKEAT
jgi:hypothetical protein